MRLSLHRSVLSGLALAAALAGSAPALTQQPPVAAPPRIDLGLAEMNRLRTIQRRELGMFRHRLDREQDRRMNMRPRSRPHVPVMRPGCIETGRRLSRSC